MLMLLNVKIDIFLSMYFFPAVYFPCDSKNLWLLPLWLTPCLQAYELSTLTGTQVMLLVASETGHVYTFATRSARAS